MTTTELFTQAIFFDIDGVLWKAGFVLDGVVKFLEQCKSQNIKVYCVSNNSGSSTAELADRLGTGGLDGHFPADRIFSIERTLISNLRILRPRRVMLYCVNSIRKNVMAEFPEIDFVEESRFRGRFQHEIKPHDIDKHICEDEMKGVDVVVCCFSSNMDYLSYCLCMLALQANPNCKLWISNSDHVHVSHKYTLPGTGSLTSVLQHALPHMQAQYLGKPSQTLVDTVSHFLATEGYRKDQVVMIGDNLRTDIAFGKQVGMQTVLVETGVNNRDDCAACGVNPDYVISTLRELQVNNI